MKKNISKFTTAIIDGLGYEVVPGNGIQGVDFLKDKTTGEKLSSEKPQRIDGYETKIFTGKDGEKIYLSETGSMKLYFGKDIEFCVFPDLNGPASVRISIRYKDKEFSFEYYNSITNTPMISGFDGGIFVGYRDSKYLYRRIASMYYFEDAFGDCNYKFIPEECTDDNIIRFIIARMQKYYGGSYWNDIFEAMLDVIKPALSLYVEEFRNDWNIYLNNIVQREKEIQNKALKKIAKHNGVISESREREQLPIDTMNALKKATEGKNIYMS